MLRRRHAGRAFGRRSRRRPHLVFRGPAGRPHRCRRTAGRHQGQATGQSCVDCHGAEGNAPIDGTYPKLAGQYYDYIAHALQAYRDGDREHALMSSQAKDLTDQQIADLAAYFGSRQSNLRDLHNAH